MNNKQIAIIEDVESDALALKKIMENLGEFEIELYNSMEDVMAIFDKKKFDYVFLDYYLKNFKATDVLLGLGKENKLGTTKFIITTSENNPSVLLRTIKMGAHHFIFKPISVSRVKHALDILDE